MNYPDSHDFPDYHDELKVIVIDSLPSDWVPEPVLNEKALEARDQRRKEWEKTHPGQKWNKLTQKWEVAPVKNKVAKPKAPKKASKKR